MRKMQAYLLGGSLILISFVITQSCVKGSGSTTLVGNWSRSSDFDGNARSEAVIFVVGQNAFITTGSTDLMRYNDLWEFNLAQQFWAQKADFPGVARNSAVGFATDTKGYVGTGFDGVNYLNDFWEYDPTSNQWTQKSNFAGTGRYDAVAFSINNLGYVSCGFDANYLKDLWQYDPSSDQWTQKASIPGTKRSQAQVFVMNNKAYIVSGNNNGAALNDMWMYDPSADGWLQKRKITNVTDSSFDDKYTTIARYNGVAFVMGAKAYLATGESGNIITNTWEYDPSNDTWLEKTPFEGTARTGAVAFTLNDNGTDRGFVLTGRSGSLSFDNCYEWHPNDAVNANDN